MNAADHAYLPSSSGEIIAPAVVFAGPTGPDSNHRFRLRYSPSRSSLVFRGPFRFPPKTKFAADSPLEESGFEPSVPPVNELVSPAGTRMRTRRQGRSRRRRLCSGDQGLESAFLQRRESARTRDPLRSPGNLFLDLVAMQPGQTRRVGRTANAKAGPSRRCSRRRCNLRAQGGGCAPSSGPGTPVSRGSAASDTTGSCGRVLSR